TATHFLIKNFPMSIAETYYIDLPLRVDRAQIEPKNKSYIYHDLEFSLSRDEIVKLLMTKELYKSNSLCVRELLQNSLDALRHRKVLFFRDDSIDWDKGKIVFEHFINENGHEVLRCIDNGVGMDQDIIIRFLTKVGRSFYRSPEFEQERLSFVNTNNDFDPCAQFGIGFMSCFMIGDHINILTRKDYGRNKGWGEPLQVEINGLGGIIVIKKGSYNQLPGTIVEIIGRKKPAFFDEWVDNIRLIEVLNGYALACEFPIEGRCEIPEVKESIEIPSGISIPKTNIEYYGIKSHLTLTQDFSEIDINLNGIIKASFLTDDKNNLTLSNSEASWRIEDDALVLYSAEGEKMDYYELIDNGQTCVDGILVAGTPGHVISSHRLGNYSNRIDLGRDCFILDVRGHLKPPLTPARFPPDDTLHKKNAKWNKLQAKANLAYGRLWEKVVSYTNFETFWALITIHNAFVPFMRSTVIWSKIFIPTFNNDKVDWCPVSHLGIIYPIKEGDSFSLITSDGAKICAPEFISKWERRSHGESADYHIKNTVISMSSVFFKENQPVIEVTKPSDKEKIPWTNYFLYDYSCLIVLIPYIGELKSYLYVQLPFKNANSEHPLVKLILDSQYVEESSDFQVFSRSLIIYFNNLKYFKQLKKVQLEFSSSNNPLKRRLGCLFQSIDWNQISEKFHPPYKVWLEDQGHIENTEEHFRLWALNQ
ncbi:MAG TPA: hypothetical protein VHY08_29930, partial [Bacillota bacterium]|nr:hypothetical protein [Bacillota bacterium]